MTQKVFLDWPLMKGNITRSDLDVVIDFLKQEDPILTQSHNVSEFENEWSQWLGREFSVFVNSGSSANLLTMTALKEMVGGGEIVVPALTWVSDIASVVQCGFHPVIVDIEMNTLGASIPHILDSLTKKTRGVFLTHILGYNALTQELLDVLKEREIPLIEDVCESHGTTFNGDKVGRFGLASNFSFYYAHHMSTIEGGIISTDDPDMYEIVRMLRSHGMVRESRSEIIRQKYAEDYSDLNPEFIFAYTGYNVRSTEINALIGRSQLSRLDINNDIRRRNFKCFLDNLDSSRYYTEFAVEGSCNYAFTLILRHADDEFRDKVMDTMRNIGVEFRRGTSGGGNQLRQPYLRDIIGDVDMCKYPNTEHVHFYGFYIGNYPGLERQKILDLCGILNEL